LIWQPGFITSSFLSQTRKRLWSI